jgi:hypothetical protein
MAWGTWNKIANGLKTAWNWGKKIISHAAPIISTIGSAIGSKYAGSKFGDMAGKIGGLAQKADQFVNKSQPRLGAGGAGIYSPGTLTPRLKGFIPDG